MREKLQGRLTYSWIDIDTININHSSSRGGGALRYDFCELNACQVFCNEPAEMDSVKGKYNAAFRLMDQPIKASVLK